MKIKRIIPALTILDNDLVKTKFFDQSNTTYIGDILNAVKIFNDYQAEEIIIYDIGSTINKVDPNYELIKKISGISRMPICYGGGIKSLSQAKKILSYGIEKISISSLYFENKNEVKKLVKEVGAQSVSVTIDIKKIDNQYFIFTKNGSFNTNKKPLELIEEISDIAGEIVINNIDLDGTMTGPDHQIISQIYEKIKIPLVIIGGIGEIDDIIKLCNKYDLIGVACGSLFIYKGKNNAVLINYPIEKIRKKIIN